jgi:hypothetical protein
MDNEKEYLEALKENGVDLPELENPTPTEPKEQPKDEPEPKEEPKAKPEDKDEPEDESEEEEVEPKTSKPRSIYQQYKEKKKDLHTEKERREQLEKENQELKALIEKGGKATTKEEKEDVQDELAKFAEENEMSPETLKQLKAIMTKDIPTLSDEDREVLNNAKQLVNSKNDEQSFEQEFSQATPSLQEFFPDLSKDDTKVIKDKLYELAHTEGYHDKELDYIIYKNKDVLSKILSPKKRGLESKSPQEKNGVKATTNVDLSVTPDFSKMTEAEITAWQKAYSDATSSNDGLSVDRDGRKIII